MPFGEAEEKAILERAVGRSPEVARWIAICKKEPTKTETGKEVEENCEVKYKGYKRVEVKGTASWNAATGASPCKITNAAEIKAPKFEAGGSEEESKAIAVAVLSAEKEGTQIGYAKLTNEVKIAAGNPEAAFAAAALEVTLT
jgi:hypothetical protein